MSDHNASDKGGLFTTLLGVFGAVGRWPQWQHFFDPTRRGIVTSFIALLFCVPSLWFVAQQIENERARQLGTEAPAMNLLNFGVVIVALGVVFALTALIIATLLGRKDGLSLWLVARNWAVFYLCAALAAVFALTAYTPLPFAMANGALFAAYLGLLPIDIRLAQRAGGFTLMSAILIGCVVVSTSMMVLLGGVLLSL